MTITQAKAMLAECAGDPGTIARINGYYNVTDAWIDESGMVEVGGRFLNDRELIGVAIDLWYMRNVIQLVLTHTETESEEEGEGDLGQLTEKPNTVMYKPRIEEETMKITEEYLRSKSVCTEWIEWFRGQDERRPKHLLQNLIKERRLDLANWLLCRLLTKKQRIRYACYAAKRALPIYEKEFPDDKRPRNAIMAATRCIKSGSKADRNDATYAANAACAAAWDAALVVDDARTYAAYAATYAADATDLCSTYAADAAADSAADAAAADSAADATLAYGAELTSILHYGIRLLDD